MASVKTDNALHIYILSIKEEFLKHYDFAIKKLDEEAIHKLRVSLKQFKSSLTLLGALNPNLRAEGLFKQAGKLFKKLGKIRDLQVSLALIRHDSIYKKKCGERFYNHLNNQLNVREKKLKSWLPKFDHHSMKATFSKAENHTNHLNNPLILDFSYRQIRQLKIEISGYKQTELHRARISLKQLHHTLDVCRKIDQNFLRNEMDVEKLKKIEKILGNWHDLVILNLILDKYIRDHKNTGMVRFRNKLRKKVKKHSEEAKEEFRQIGL